MNLGAGKLKHMEHGKTEPRLQPVGDVKWFQSTGKGNRLWIPQAGKVHQTQEELYWSITCINQNVWIPTGAVTGATSVGRYWSVLGLGFTRQLLWPWRSSHCRDVRKQQHHVSGKLLVLVMNKPQSILLLSVERVSWFFLRRWRDFEAFFFPVRESNLWSFQKHLRFFFLQFVFWRWFLLPPVFGRVRQNIGSPNLQISEFGGSEARWLQQSNVWRDICVELLWGRLLHPFDRPVVFPQTVCCALGLLNAP